MKTFSQIVGGVQRAINLVSAVLAGLLCYLWAMTNSGNGLSLIPNIQIGNNIASNQVIDGVSGVSYGISVLTVILLLVSIILGIILAVRQKKLKVKVTLKDLFMSITIFVIIFIIFVSSGRF